MEIIESLILNGDISRMTPQQKVIYYKKFCEYLGLNPITKPFQILKLQGKEVLYATKDATEQLRKINKIKISLVSTQKIDGCFQVVVKAVDIEGREDFATGVVYIEGLKGDALANALMKAETKAKRRATLSICGLGILDESEIETIQGAETENINIDNSIQEKYQIFLKLLNEKIIPSEKNRNIERVKEMYEKKELTEKILENAIKFLESLPNKKIEVLEESTYEEGKNEI